MQICQEIVEEDNPEATERIRFWRTWWMRDHYSRQRGLDRTWLKVAPFPSVATRRLSRFSPSLSCVAEAEEWQGMLVS